MTDLSSTESVLLELLLGESGYGAVVSQWRMGSQYFVISLTEVPDLLSQWRAYAWKSGYCLGLSVAALRKLAAENRFQLRPCVYNEGEQRSLIAPVLNAAIARWRANPVNLDLNSDFWAPRTEDDAMEFIKLTAIHAEFDREFSLVATICKNAAFAEEREWRLVSEPVPSSRHPKVQFREGRSVLIPYVHFDIDLQPFAAEEQQVHIVCGPSPELELSQRSAIDMLGAHGWPSIWSQRSLVPYRDW